MNGLSGAARAIATLGVVVALTGSALAGCGTTTTGTPVTGTGAAGPPGASGLVDALGRVRATKQSVLMVEYGNVAAIRKLTETDQQRFRTLEGYGYSEIVGRPEALADVVGFDPRQATEAIRVGQPPNWAGVLRMKVDVNAVNGKFDGLGAKRADEAGATTWITGEDGEVDMTSPFAKIGIVAGFNKVRVAADSIAYSPSGAALAWVVDPGGSTLAQDKDVRGLATCLGDVTAAIINMPEQGRSPVAVGVRTGDNVTEVICAPTADPNGLREKVQARLDSVTPERGGPVWSTVFRDATAEAPADQPGMVRVLVPAGQGATVGRVFRALLRNDLPALFG